MELIFAKNGLLLEYSNRISEEPLQTSERERSTVYRNFFTVWCYQAETMLAWPWQYGAVSSWSKNKQLSQRKICLRQLPHQMQPLTASRRKIVMRDSLWRWIGKQSSSIWKRPTMLTHMGYQTAKINHVSLTLPFFANMPWIISSFETLFHAKFMKLTSKWRMRTKMEWHNLHPQISSKSFHRKMNRACKILFLLANRRRWSVNSWRTWRTWRICPKVIMIMK